MKTTAKLFWLTCVFVGLTAGPLQATQPGADVNPNGFPSGFHYTLNIHAKNESFVCDYDRDENGQIVYGHVINVPDYLDGAEVKMLSGKGKKAEQFTDLVVTDPCAGFPNNRNLTDHSYAQLQLPKNDYGYDVYARPLGKTSNGDVVRDITITPTLDMVMMEEYDADGNLVLDANGDPVTTDLLYLGMVTDKGFVDSSKTLERKRGKSTAVDLTGLFQWSGDVCYFDSTGYCDGECTSKEICCTTETQDINGTTVEVHDYCEDALPDPDMPGEFICRETDTSAGELPLSLITVDCKTYEDTWVFNIADLVSYLWNVDSNVKQFNVRFYPRSQ
jgi:hypothetical protein